MEKKKRISDIITKEEVSKWEIGSNILVSAPMGAGKSYFCKNTLYELAKEVNGRILMLIHRSNCVEQFKYEIERDGKADVIDVRTYQSLEYGSLHNTKNQINLSDYKYIVSDEFHYFFNDSSFNNKTAISFQMIMNSTDTIHIFMSATGEHMTRYMEKYIKENNLKEAIEYEIPFDFSFIRQLTFFHKDVTMEEFIKEGIEQGDKGIFFIQSAEKAYKLYSKFKKHCVFNCSANNKKYYKYVDEDTIKNILKNERFEEQFLITTSCFDAGINIIDREVKHIVIDIVDIGSLIQCMGRKRIQDKEDDVNIYIKIINNQKLAGLRRSIQQKVEMADFYIKSDYSVEQLLKKYPRENDVNNILYNNIYLIYSEEDDSVIGTQIMYFKKRSLETLKKYLPRFLFDTVEELKLEVE